MKPARDAKPTETSAPDVLAAPDFQTLRTLRRAFARGGLPAAAARSPEDEASIACFVTLAELLRVLDAFRTRIARGERVRLVMREQPTVTGTMRVEIAIEGRGS